VGIDAIRERETRLASMLAAGLREIPGAEVFHPEEGPVTAAVSFRIRGMENTAIAGTLADEYGICCRHGLQCAPCAHRTLGTLPAGLVRLSPGFFNTDDEINSALDAVRTAQRRCC